MFSSSLLTTVATLLVLCFPVEALEWCELATNPPLPPECTTGVCKFTSAQAEACWDEYPYDETVCDIAMKPCWDASISDAYSCSEFASCSTQCSTSPLLYIRSKTAVCAITDGTAANTQDCACGTTECDASTGHYCSSSINTCYKAPCATLFLSASGPTTQSSRLGTYTWMGSNSGGGKPAYKSGTNYLYWNNENEKWYISEVLGSSTDASMYWSSSEMTPDLSSTSPTEIKAKRKPCRIERRLRYLKLNNEIKCKNELSTTT